MTNAFSPSQPRLSVVVPTFQRPERLAACVQALARQELPRDRFEVIVVNDGGVSPAPAIAPFASGLDLRVIDRDNGGPAAARNSGAAAARGSHVVFTDDDCLPEPGWLTALARAADAWPDALIGGAIVNALPDDLFATTTQLIVSAVYEYHERHPGTERLFNTSNFMVPADAFRALGGFSERFPLAAGEDYDLCARWHASGRGSRYAADAVVRHAHPLTFRAFFRQHYNYGRGLLRFRQRSAQRRGGRLRLEAPRFYANLLSYPLRQGMGARGVVHAGLVVFSQAATALGALAETIAPAAPRTADEDRRVA